MKYLLVIIFGMSLMFTAETANACEIKFTLVSDDNIASYKGGDEIIVKVEVVFTHRVCHEGIENTKFKYDGVKVLGATKWTEYEAGKFERKLKLQVLENKPGDLVLEAIRTCDKEGGYTKIVLKSA